MTITLDLTPEVYDWLGKMPGRKPYEKVATENLAGEKLDATEVEKAQAEQTTQNAKTPAPTAAPKVSLSDVRAEALRLSKAGRSADLSRMFAKYGAKKISAIAEADYPALLEDLKAVT